jgi:hypothetical protein
MEQMLAPAALAAAMPPNWGRATTACAAGQRRGTVPNSASATATSIAIATNSEWMSLTYRALHKVMIVPPDFWRLSKSREYPFGCWLGPVYFRHLAGILREYEDDLTPLRMLGGRVDCARKAMGLGL